MRRIGIDVGGTFTDVVLLDDATGEVWSTKVPSTPRDPSVGAISGLNRILELSATTPANVGFVGHGTTIATNMVIEGKGAKTALITTKGFRDILEIRRAWRHDRADLYVSSLQVDGRFHGPRVVGGLLAAAVPHLRAALFHRLATNVGPWNTVALRLCGRVGFVEVARRAQSVALAAGREVLETPLARWLEGRGSR